MRRTFLLVLVLLAHPMAYGAAPGADLERALALIMDNRFALARTYLDGIVVSPRISGPQRSRAYYFRGHTFYAQGLYVSAAQDYARALEFDTGNAAALAALGHMLAEGLGVDQDLPEAFRLFLKGARAGNTAAKFYVGFALLTGTGTDPDVEKARIWLREAADDGNVRALTQLARSYREPFATQPDPVEAQRLYEQAAAQGDLDALLALGFQQLKGELGEADPARAVAYFRQAAEAGLPPAQAGLAHAYLTGTGIERDPAEARRWYEQAAGAGFPPALLQLGYIFEGGVGVPADIEVARDYYLRCARLGEIRCQLRLANSYLTNAAGQNDYAEAILWFREAAALGSVAAKNAAAWILSTNPYAVLRDGAAAVVLAREAVAEQPSSSFLDTLAAAYAEAGNFEDAVLTQELAIAAIGEGETDLDAEFQDRLERYQRRETYRE